MEKGFYMIWADKGSKPPMVKHYYKNEADDEAARLAAANPGQRFYVLRAERYVEHNNVRRVELEKPGSF